MAEADLQGVADGRAFDGSPANDGSIGTSQVSHPPLSVLEPNFDVPLADRGVVDDDVVVGRAANGEALGKLPRSVAAGRVYVYSRPHRLSELGCHSTRLGVLLRTECDVRSFFPPVRGYTT